MLRWVICTAFGEPVDPDVNCISARSSSPTSIGSIGSAASRSPTVKTLMPFSSSTGIATRNGSDTMTALASIMPMTFMVSSAHTTRSVRGVGWCSIGQARATHPQALRSGSDLDRESGQHADRVAETDAGRGESTGDALGPLVHLAPGVPDRFVRFAGDHAPAAGAGITVHLLGESAHHDLLADICPGAHARLPCSAWREAFSRRRAHIWGAVVSRIGDVP